LRKKGQTPKKKGKEETTFIFSMKRREKNRFVPLSSVSTGEKRNKDAFKGRKRRKRRPFARRRKKKKKEKKKGLERRIISSRRNRKGQVEKEGGKRTLHVKTHEILLHPERRGEKNIV